LDYSVDHEGGVFPLRVESCVDKQVASWLDWAPEAESIQPDIFVVNEEGDRPEKRAYCDAHGISYWVLQRLPRPGLPARSSTELRGY
jgi:hypothetical protein